MDNVYKKVQNLHNRFKDTVDEPNSAIATSLRNDIQRLEDEIEMQKNKGTLEDRVKDIIRKLESHRNDSFMSYDDVKFLMDRFDDLRQDIRKL